MRVFEIQNLLRDHQIEAGISQNKKNPIPPEKKDKPSKFYIGKGNIIQNQQNHQSPASSSS